MTDPAGVLLEIRPVMNNPQIIQDDLLVVRNDRLGDTILALPVIPLLQKAFPDNKIHFLTAPQFDPLIECVAGIDSVIVGNDKGEPDVGNDLAALKIGTAFCLRPTFKNALVLRKAQIPVRIGTSRRWYSFLFNKRINLSRRGKSRHEADLNLDMLAAVGISGETGFPAIELPEMAKDKIADLLAQAGFSNDNSYIVIHPGSGGSAQNWSVDYFKQLADKLNRIHKLQIIVTGSISETALCREVAGDTHINLCGKTELLELASLLKNARLLIANSTGPLHLSVALGTISLGLYAPLKDCLPDRWGPYCHPEWALMPDLPLCERCHPGSVSQCYCMEQLTVDTVYDRAIELLH